MNFVKETINIIKQYENLKIAKANLTRRYKEIIADLESIKAIDMSGMPKGSGAGQPDDKICNLIYERDTVKSCLIQNKQMLIKIDKYFENVTDEEKEIIFRSYAGDKTDNELAKELNISRRTLIDKRNKYIRKLAVQIWGIEAI